MRKIIRTATIPLSLDLFCHRLLSDLSERYEVVALSSPGKELDAIAQREGVRTISIPIQRQMSPYHDCISLFRLIRVFQQEGPELVHSITPKAGLLSMLAAKIVGVPVRVHTFTGLLFPTAHGWRKKILMLTDKLTCTCATHVVAEGEGVRNDLTSHGITRKEIRILGYGNVRGIDLNWYARTPEVMAKADDIRRKLGIRQEQFTFIFVGRMVGDKGINELVDMFCTLHILHPEIHLILVGEEPGRNCSLKKVTRHKITATNHIHIVEWQTDVRPWYAAADALVFPSYREGFPNVVIESGAMQLPSVVTDVNGSREIIQTGKTGIIVPPNDSTALYHAMKWIVEHPAEAKSYGINARSRVAARYEQNYVHQCLKTFYKSILK
jgi:glycosyltransferase involved in cell wall biosynthesis